MPRCSVWLLLFLLEWSYGHSDTSGSSTGKPPLWNVTWTDTLKRDLLLNYDKFARPTQHFNTTRVNLEMVFRHIDLDDTKSLMTVNGWAQLSWLDEKLKWNSSEYGGLSTLHVADHEIWEPDVVLYNSAIGNNVDHYGNTHCLVHEDGTVLWVPPAQFSFFCDLDLTTWPFDRHTCSLRLGSWTYSGEQIDLRTNESKGVEVKVDVSEWHILGVTKKRSVTYYPCCTEPYVDIEFNVSVARRSPSYHAVIINPALAVVIMTLSVFWLPPHASEKFLVAGVTIVFICIYLIYFSQRLPSMGQRLPLIVLFYSNSLILVCLCLVVSVITYNLCRVRQSKPLPWAVTSFLSSPLALILWLPPLKNSMQGRAERGVSEEMTERGFEDEGCLEERSMLPASGSKDWLVLAIAVDRLAFILYLIVFASLGIRALV